MTRIRSSNAAKTRVDGTNSLPRGSRLAPRTLRAERVGDLMTQDLH